MCGRFLAVQRPTELARLFRVDEISPAASALGPRYNIGPGAPAAIIFDTPPPDQSRTEEADSVSFDSEPADSTTRTRHLKLARFGLTPSWLRSGRVPAKLVFNARAETVAEKVSFRDALATRRCIIPADGFYEWGDDSREEASRYGSGATGSGSPSTGSQARGPGEYQLFAGPARGDRARSRGDPSLRVSGGRGSGRARVPWCFRAAGQDTLVLAGLYELDRPRLDGSRLDGTQRRADTELSCVVLTTNPTAVVARVHDRMPLLLSGDDVELWLSEGPLDPARLGQIVARSAASSLISYRVSTALGSSRVEGPELARPIN